MNAELDVDTMSACRSDASAHWVMPCVCSRAIAGPSLSLVVEGPYFTDNKNAEVDVENSSSFLRVARSRGGMYSAEQHRVDIRLRLWAK